MDPESWIQGMPASHVYFNHPLFEQYDETKFANNFNALVRNVQADKLASEFDQLKLADDKKVHPRPQLNSRSQPFWDTHPAKSLVIDEIKSEAIKDLTPAQVRERRDEYKEFDALTFRQYLNMEKRHIREKVFWQAKRNRKARKQHDKEVAAAAT